MRTVFFLLVVSLMLSACSTTALMSQGADPLDVSFDVSETMLEENERDGVVTALYFSPEEFLRPNFTEEPLGPFVQPVVLSGDPLAHQVFRHLPWSEPTVVIEVLEIEDPNGSFRHHGPEERLLAIETGQVSFQRIGYLEIQRCRESRRRRNCQMTLEGIRLSVEPYRDSFRCYVLRPRYNVRCDTRLFY